MAAEPTDDLSILRAEEEAAAPGFDPVFSGWSEGIVALESGDLDTAEIHLRDVLTAPRSKRCAAADVLALCALVRINLARGQTGPAEELQARALSAAEKSGSTVWGWVHATRARIARHSGNPLQSTEAWRDAVDAFRNGEAWAWATDAANALVPTSIAAGAPSRAVSVLQLVPDAPGTSAGIRLLVARAELAEALGDVSRALRLTQDLEADPVDPDTVHRLAAVRLRCAMVKGTAPPAVDLPPLDNATAEGVRLLLTAATAGIAATSHIALQTRAEQLGRPDLAAMAAGLSAHAAAVAGDPDAAIHHLTNAENLAQRSGNASCLLRTARQRARIELDLGLGAPARIRSLLQVHLEQARETGDTQAEAQARLLLAQCVPVVPDEAAATHAAAAQALAQQHGYEPMAVLAAALAAVFDHDAELTDNADHGPLVTAVTHIAHLSRASDVHDAVSHLHRTHELLAQNTLPPSRALKRVMRRAMHLAGLQMVAEGTGPDLVVHEDTGQFWIEGTPLAKLKPNSIPFKLLHTIALEGSRLDKGTLFEKVWDQPYRPPSSDNTLYVTLHRLRGRLKDGIIIDPTEDGGYAIRDRPSVFQWFDVLPTVPLNPFPTISPAADPPEATKANTNIPEPLDTFVGRRQGVAQLLQRYGTGTRLVTLTGPMGVGKSRLARHFGRDQANRSAHSGGVWFAEIARSTTEEAFLTAVARALDVPLVNAENTLPTTQISAELEARGEVLLILDGLDALAGDVAETVEAWLAAAPRLRILVTSTVPMNCPSDRQLELEPMHEDEAVALFCDRAQRVRPGFMLNESIRPTIVGLVKKLDGLPLAIELAAARMDLVDPEALHVQLLDRFRDMQVEDMTMDKAIRWAWELLSEWEQAVLAQCSVFRGGFSAKDAEAVVDLRATDAPWVGEVIDALRRRSLLQSQSNPGHTAPRFELLQAVNRFAAGFVEDEASVLARHADHTIAQGEARIAGLYGSGGPTCLNQLIEDVGNTLAVVERFRGSDLSRAARAALIATEVLSRVGPFDKMIRLLDQTAQIHTALEPALAVRILLAQAQHMVHVEPEISIQALEQASTQAQEIEDQRLLGQLAYTHGWVWMHRPGRLPDADVAFQEARSLFEAAGHTAGVALTLQRLGVTQLWQQDASRAATLLEQAVAIHESIGDVLHLAPALGNLGSCDRALGRDSAIRRLQRALSQAQDNQDTALIGTVHANLANAYYGRWRTDAARYHYGEAIEHLRRAGRHRQSAITQLNLGVMCAAQGDGEAARTQLHRARTRLESVGEAGVAVRATLHLAHAHLEAGDVTLMLELLDEARAAIAEHGSGSPARKTLLELDGALALEQGDTSGARKAWTALLSEGEDPAVQSQIALVDHLEGETDKAKDSYTACLAELDSPESERLRGRIRMRLACLLASMGESEPAEFAMTEARAHLEASQDLVGLRNMDVLMRCGFPDSAALAAAADTVPAGGLEQRLLFRLFLPE